MSRMNHNKPKWDESHSSRKGNKLKPNTWESVTGGLGNLTTKYNYLALCLVGVIGAAFDFFIRNKKAKKQILRFCSLLVAIGNLLMMCLQATGGRNRNYMRRSNKHK